MQAPQSTPSTPLGACGTWGPPPDVATVRNRHGRLLGLQNDPNGGWAARQSPTWWPTTWPQAVPPHSPTVPPYHGGPWGRGLWHTRSDSAAWLGLAGPGGRLPARNRPIWAPGAPGQLPPHPLCSLVFSCFGYFKLTREPNGSAQNLCPRWRKLSGTSILLPRQFFLSHGPPLCFQALGSGPPECAK